MTIYEICEKGHKRNLELASECPICKELECIGDKQKQEKKPKKYYKPPKRYCKFCNDNVVVENSYCPDCGKKII